MGFEQAIQAAFFSALDGEISCQVYDCPPKNAVYPYVVIGDDSLADFGTVSTIGRETISTVHVFDNNPGKKRIKQIMGDIDEILDRAQLSHAGFHFIECSFDSSDTFLDSDGKTYHGVISFRLLIDRG